jgi:hypothetical protein
VLAQLGDVLVPDKQFELMGFDGIISTAPVAQLELAFADKRFRGQFLIIDQEWGILGRNILNAMAILLDGPHLMWRIDPNRQ